LRDEYIKNFGFSLISDGLVDALTSQLSGKKVLEVGAGTGFLSSVLQKNGIGIIPIDCSIGEKNEYGFSKIHTPITKAEASDFLKTENNFDAVIMSWANYNSNFAYTVLSKMKKGQLLYYCGEGAGGCTGDDRFHDILSSNTVIQEKISLLLRKLSVNWNGLHDRWNVYKIK